MSTMLVEHPDHWTVSTIVGEGKQHKLPRLHVRVGKGDPDALRAEIIRQAEAARAKFGLSQTTEAPVV